MFDRELTSHRTLQATSIRSIRQLAPLLDRVLVQRVKAEAKTAGGIFLPESSVEKLNEAKVLAVGPGALDKKGNRLPMGVVAGDRVLIPQVGSVHYAVGEVGLRRCANWGNSSAVPPSRPAMRSTSCSVTASKWMTVLRSRRLG